MSLRYAVTYQINRHPGEVQSRRETFISLKDALEEKERVAHKNELFIEVDGFTPHVFDVKVWEVETTHTWTEIET